MKTYAIGDLHGHFDQWLRLYQKLLDNGLKPEIDTLVFLGDYVDGGDQVCQLLDWLIEKKKQFPHWQMLYGNHEDLMLDALVYNGRIYGSFDLWYQQGGKQTFESYLPPGLTRYEKAVSQVKDHIKVEHLDWLRQLPMFYENDNFFFVHAGLVPGISIKEHKEKLEKGGQEAEDFKQNMIWIRGQFYRSQYKWEKRIIFGHTVFKQPLFRDTMIGIDCMNHNMGMIIALEMGNEKLYIESSQVD